MNAREALQAYAVAAAELEDAKRAVSDTEQRLQEAGEEAIDRLDGAGIGLPVTVTLPDGRAVTIDEVAEEYNYHLEYTVSEALSA
jgi:hypothetical protein